MAMAPSASVRRRAAARGCGKRDCGFDHGVLSKFADAAVQRVDLRIVAVLRDQRLRRGAERGQVHFVELHAGLDHGGARPASSCCGPQPAHHLHRFARQPTTMRRGPAAPARRRCGATSAARRARRNGRCATSSARPRSGGWTGSCGCCSPRRRSCASPSPENTSPSGSGVGLAPNRRSMRMKMSETGTRIFRPCRSAVPRSDA